MSIHYWKDCRPKKGKRSKRQQKIEKLEKKYYAQQAVGCPEGCTPSHQGYHRPRRQFDNRCSTCEGSGKMRGLHGFETCSRCEGKGRLPS